MSGISFINRFTGASNNVVYIETSDTTAVASAANYITKQTANITAVNEGPWTWESNDCIMLSASDGLSWCTINSTFTTITPFSSSFNAPTAQLKQASFTLTQTQVNAAYATPVQIIGAPGAGLVRVPELITLELIFAAAVTGGSSANIGFQYGSTAHLGGVVATNTEQASDLTGATANTMFNFITANGNGAQWLASGVANTALFFSVNTATLTGGSGNTYNGNIFYRDIPIS